MTKETSYNTSEDDTSDNENDSKESRSKKTTKISRAVPLTVKLQTESESTPEQPRPVLSFGERFMQELQRRSAREQERLENDTESDDDEDDEDDEDERSTSVVAGDDRSVQRNAEATAEPPVVPSVQLETHAVPQQEASHVDPLEAADWEHEPTEADNQPAEDDNEERFVDVPVTNPEVPVDEVEDADPELLQSGLGAEEPPEPPNISHDERTYPEFGPDDQQTMVPVHESAWYNPVAAERAARETTNEDSDALYRAEKHGLRRGLTAGLFFGWMFGRRGKKQAAEQHKKELRSKEKDISALKNEQLLAQQRLEAMRRTQDSLRANIIEKPAEAPVSTTRKPEAQTSSAENVPLQATEVLQSSHTEVLSKHPGLRAAEIVAMAAAEVVSVTEKAPMSTMTEKYVSAHEKPSQKAEVEKTSPEERAITEETYVTSKDRRVESSAWHRIEIDAKTGKPVSDPEVAYGEEFKRERRQEVWKDVPGDTDSKSSAGVLGSLAAGALTGGSPHASAIAQTDDDQGLSVPVPEHTSEGLHAGNELLKYASMPVVWVVAIFLVVILFIVGFLR